MNIEIELSPESVKAAIAKLEAYRDSLRDKNDEFVKKLAEIGIPIIHSKVNEAAGEGTNTTHVVELDPKSFGDFSQCTVTLSGSDILFIEFGAGVTYNPDETPHAEEFGYGIGTYPGQTHAFDEDGWWYRDESGVGIHTYGTRATMPMLQASKEMILKIREIAREVYGS